MIKERVFLEFFKDWTDQVDVTGILYPSSNSKTVKPVREAFKEFLTSGYLEKQQRKKTHTQMVKSGKRRKVTITKDCYRANLRRFFEEYKIWRNSNFSNLEKRVIDLCFESPLLRDSVYTLGKWMGFVDAVRTVILQQIIYRWMSEYTPLSPSFGKEISKAGFKEIQNDLKKYFMKGEGDKSILSNNLWKVVYKHQVAISKKLGVSYEKGVIERLTLSGFISTLISPSIISEEAMINIMNNVLLKDDYILVSMMINPAIRSDKEFTKLIPKITEFNRSIGRILEKNNKEGVATPSNL